MSFTRFKIEKIFKVEPTESFTVKMLLIVLSIFGTVLLNACGLANLGMLESPKPSLSLIASSKKISEGQQIEIQLILDKASKEDIRVEWGLLNNESSLQPHASEFAKVSDSVIFKAGETSSIFHITSLPASLESTEKIFKLRLSSDQVSRSIEYIFIVSKNIGSYAVSIVEAMNNSTINIENRSAYKISGVCSHSNTDVNLSVGDINHLASCSEALTWNATLNLTSLSDGNHPLVATHGAEENGALASRALKKDTIPPSIQLLTPTPGTQISSSNASSFSLSGICSENLQTISLTATSQGGGGQAFGSAMCASSDWSSILNLEFIPNGEVSILIEQSDFAGNRTQLTHKFLKDAAVPVFTIAEPAADHIFNSQTFNKVLVSGECSKENAEITLSGAVAGRAICDGASWSASGLELSGADGVKTISASIVDGAGNKSSIEIQVRKYTLQPTAILFGYPTGINNTSELNVSAVGVERYRYKLGDAGTVSCASELGYSLPVNSSVVLTDSAGADGPKRLCVVGIDSYGNQQSYANATISEWIKKTSLPHVALTAASDYQYINSSTVGSFLISGTCSEVGRPLNIQGSIPVNSVNCLSGGTWSKILDLTAVPDGSVVILLTHADIAGNTQQDLKVYTKKTNMPTINISTSEGTWINRSNRAGFALSGDCSDYSAGNNIEITGADVAVFTNCMGGTGWNASVTFSGSSNGGSDGVNIGTKILKVTITDAAGNKTSSSKTFNIKTTAPSIAIHSPALNSYINDTTKSALSVSGACSEERVGSVIVIASDANTEIEKTTDCAAGLFELNGAEALNVAGLLDGDISLKVKVTDIASNSTEKVIALKKKVTLPAIAWQTPANGTCVGEVNKSAFSIAGDCDSGVGSTSVTVSSAKLSSPKTLNCQDGRFFGAVEVETAGLTNGEPINLEISQSDVAGNTNKQTRSFKYLSDGVTPTIEFAGWEDVYAVGVKTYAEGKPGLLGNQKPESEPGVVRFKWKAWSIANTCQPESVNVYRSPSLGGSLTGTKVNDVEILSNSREFSDETLAGAKPNTADAATDFGKTWYYGLKVKIAGSFYDVTPARGGQELRIIAPPDNMSMVHRWIANQEMCGLMGRAPDKNNNYACPYTGWGRSLVNDGFYDFDHDLLVDRHHLSCNYSLNCGPNGDEACIASNFTKSYNTEDVNAQVGSVFYDNLTSQGYCRIKVSSGWTTANWIDANNSMIINHQYAVTDKANRPPLVRISQDRSSAICGSMSVDLVVNNSVAQIFAKRLLRNKEWKAAAAWSPGLTDARIVALENGGATTVEDEIWGHCNSNSRSGIGTLGSLLPGTVDRRAHDGATLGGTRGTGLCQSRYGIQDMVGNVWEWVSDQMESCNNLTGLGCKGRVSLLDTNNKDMRPGDESTAFRFDDMLAPGGAIDNLRFEDESYGAKFFSVPLGFPLLQNDGGNAIGVGTWLIPSNRFHGDRIYLSLTNANASRGLLLGGYWGNGSYGGRWASYWYHAPTYTNSYLGLRCVLPVQ